MGGGEKQGLAITDFTVVYIKTGFEACLSPDMILPLPSCDGVEAVAVPLKVGSQFSLLVTQAVFWV